MISLIASKSKACVLPEMGGGLAFLESGDLPVLRTWSGNVADGPFALACNLLVPFSNRIPGSFTHDGQHYNVQPNFPGEAFPIHGDSFQRVWDIVGSDQSHAYLSLPNGQIGPFRYKATVSYDLRPNELVTTLSVTNQGSFPLPFGLGFHPWFPRNPETRLQFVASGQWPETSDHLPSGLKPDALANGGPWRVPAPLPQAWVNMGFSGWDGHAEIFQSQMAASVKMKSLGMDTAILFSPSKDSNFFCFEPVTHPVNAHNLPGQPGLTILAQGAVKTVSMTLTWDMTE